MINIRKIGLIFFATILLFSCSSRKEQSAEERYGKWDNEMIIKRTKDSAIREIWKVDSAFWDNVLQKK